ncbi:PAS domain S-box protein [Neorhizobium sp. T786]|uniref:PAS domain S-box protein n=1 Tax=Pseudorhizobium xiangyangii TaxID=2883104 RepID=UPI001CFFBE84|nr:PAS domain S-box protein [Neorhizobium xiangyangii]
MTSSASYPHPRGAPTGFEGGSVSAPANPLAVPPYDPKELLASIVESSQDAIISKTINGVIMSWNSGAEALFGYRAEEVIGKSITILIPEDRQEEETTILSRLRAGQKVDHFDTVRRRKDGSLVDISLTISPIRDGNGTIVGASKVARDVSGRKRAEERQRLLLGEMHHRVKNLFALTSGLITMASKSAASPADLAASMRQRLSTLAAAHEMTLASLEGQDQSDSTATLLKLIEIVVAPYQDAQGHRISLIGRDVSVAQSHTTKMALLFYELATNAAKYGALSVPEGRVTIAVQQADGVVHLEWRELGGPVVPKSRAAAGFGTRLIDTTAASFPASIKREWKSEGLAIEFEIKADILIPPSS